MKKLPIIKVLMITISIFIFTSCSTDENQTVVNFNNLILEDNFDVNGSPDSALWTPEIGTGNFGWGNGELQYYTDRTDNLLVESGMLHITAQKESLNGSNYTSARLITKGKFEKAYGRFEARIKLPYGQGIWPAFWLLGGNCDEISWPQCGEIDIMEYRGQEPTKVLGTLHGPGYSAGESIGKTYELMNARFDTDFHIFGIEWGPGYVNWYIDDVLYNQSTPEDVPGEWVYDHPFYIILNVAVGGSFVGSPNEETVFPQTMQVDYVRVYEFE